MKRKNKLFSKKIEIAATKTKYFLEDIAKEAVATGKFANKMARNPYKYLNMDAATFLSDEKDKRKRAYREARYLVNLVGHNVALFAFGAYPLALIGEYVASNQYEIVKSIACKIPVQNISDFIMNSYYFLARTLF